MVALIGIATVLLIVFAVLLARSSGEGGEAATGEQAANVLVWQ
jgi:preprotein translocase subunit SecG